MAESVDLRYSRTYLASNVSKDAMILQSIRNFRQSIFIDRLDDRSFRIGIDDGSNIEHRFNKTSGPAIR